MDNGHGPPEQGVAAQTSGSGPHGGDPVTVPLSELGDDTLRAMRDTLLDDMQEACAVVLRETVPALHGSRSAVLTSLAAEHAVFRNACVGKLPASFDDSSPPPSALSSPTTRPHADGVGAHLPDVSNAAGRKAWAKRLDTHHAAAERCVHKEVTRITDSCERLFHSFASFVMEKQKLTLDDFFRAFTYHVDGLKKRSQAVIDGLRASMRMAVQTALREERSRTGELHAAELRRVQAELEASRKEVHYLRTEGVGQFEQLKAEYDSVLRYVSQMRRTLDLLGEALSVDVSAMCARNADGGVEVKRPAKDVLQLVKERTTTLAQAEAHARQMRQEVEEAQHATVVAQAELVEAEADLQASQLEAQQLKRQLATLRTEAGNVGKLMAEAEEAKAAAERQMQEAVKKEHDAAASIRKLNTELKKAEGRATRIQTEMEDGNKPMVQEIASLKTSLLERDTLIARLKASAAQIRDNTDELAHVRSLLRESQAQSAARRQQWEDTEAARNMGGTLLVITGGVARHGRRRAHSAPPAHVRVPPAGFARLVKPFDKGVSAVAAPTDGATSSGDSGDGGVDVEDELELTALMATGNKAAMFEEMKRTRKLCRKLNRRLAACKERRHELSKTKRGLTEQVADLKLQIRERDILLARMTSLMQQPGGGGGGADRDEVLSDARVLSSVEDLSFQLSSDNAGTSDPDMKLQWSASMGAMLDDAVASDAPPFSRFKGSFRSRPPSPGRPSAAGSPTRSLRTPLPGGAPVLSPASKIRAKRRSAAAQLPRSQTATTLSTRRPRPKSSGAAGARSHVRSVQSLRRTAPQPSPKDIRRAAEGAVEPPPPAGAIIDVPSAVEPWASGTARRASGLSAMDRLDTRRSSGKPPTTPAASWVAPRPASGSATSRGRARRSRSARIGGSRRGLAHAQSMRQPRRAEDMTPPPGLTPTKLVAPSYESELLAGSTSRTTASDASSHHANGVVVGGGFTYATGGY